jgi:phospholipid transport system substrate-binding protein
MKKMFLVIAGALLAGGVHATTPAGYPAQPAAEAVQPTMSNPAVALRAGVDRLIDFLSQQPAPSEEQLAAFLDAEIAPFFDFDHMARSAGGRLFVRLDAEQQAEITAGIKSSFLGKMAEKLAGYSDQQVRFLPPRAGNDGRTAEVSVAILNPGRYPGRLDFRLYRDAGDWRVFDVAANGQSAIVHYRRELMRQMRERRMRQLRAQMGGQMPGTMGAPRGMPGPRPMMPPAGYGTPYPR